MIAADAADPVGPIEIAARLGVSTSAVTQWRRRPTIGWPPFPDPRWTAHGRDTFHWPEVAEWNDQARPDSPLARQRADSAKQAVAAP